MADRFHLLQGLTDALEKVFLHRRSALKAAVVEASPPVEQGEEMYRGKRQVSREGQQLAETVSQERQGAAMQKYLKKLRDEALIEWKNDEIKKAYEAGLAQQEKQLAAGV